MWSDPEVREALALCFHHGRFLFEARPDLMPHGRLTAVECALWERFFEWRKSMQK